MENREADGLGRQARSGVGGESEESDGRGKHLREQAMEKVGRQAGWKRAEVEEFPP